jgi:hypothetical protein
MITKQAIERSDTSEEPGATEMPALRMLYGLNQSASDWYVQTTEACANIEQKETA